MVDLKSGGEGTRGKLLCDRLLLQLIKPYPLSFLHEAKLEQFRISSYNGCYIIRDEWDQERSDSLRYPESNKFLIIIIILSNREASTTAGQI